MKRKLLPTCILFLAIAGCATVPPPSETRTDAALEVAWQSLTRGDVDPNAAPLIVWVKWSEEDYLRVPGSDKLATGYADAHRSWCRIWLTWPGSIAESDLAHELAHCLGAAAGYHDGDHRLERLWSEAVPQAQWALYVAGY